MHDQVVLRVVAKLLIPFILLFGAYVQLHGEYSPGGGFQAGVIIAAAFILYALVFSARYALRVFPYRWMVIASAIGPLIYGGVGIVSILKGGKFLEYSVLSESSVHGQQLGIMLIELGVGITVTAVMLVLFFTFMHYEPEKQE